MQICISFASNLRKQCLCYLLFYKWWKPRLLITEQVFRRFLLNYADLAYNISHTKPSKYDSTSGTKLRILKKVGGMRLWIGTSTFNTHTKFLRLTLNAQWVMWLEALAVNHKNQVQVPALSSPPDFPLSIVW